jgi:hypothetical protein
VRGEPSPLGPFSAQLKHDPVRGAGAATAAETTNEAPAGWCDGPFPKQASVEVRLHGAWCGAGAATALAMTNEAVAGGCDGPVPKQAAAAADAGALAEVWTRTAEDKRRSLGGENATFNTETKRRPGGQWKGKTQALTPLEAQRVVASGASFGAGTATAAATANEAAAGGCEGPISKQAAAAADAGVLDGPSSFEPTSASAADAGCEPRWRA